MGGSFRTLRCWVNESSLLEVGQTEDLEERSWIRVHVPFCSNLDLPVCLVFCLFLWWQMPVSRWSPIKAQPKSGLAQLQQGRWITCLFFFFYFHVQWTCKNGMCPSQSPKKQASGNKVKASEPQPSWGELAATSSSRLRFYVGCLATCEEDFNVNREAKMHLINTETSAA